MLAANSAYKSEKNDQVRWRCELTIGDNYATNHKLGLWLLLLIGLFCTTAQATWMDARNWARITDPDSGVGVTKSIGQFTAGCVSHAQKLPINGIGYQAMRLSRQRLYGHPSLITYIEDLGHAAHDQGWGALLIGDLGQARGGPTPSGHRSHQSGLDVDIWFLLSDTAEKRWLTNDERERWSASSMLAEDGRHLDKKQWRSEHDQLLKVAASDERVARIFVNPAIKQHLCENYAGRDWLRKIRPWYQHHDHFHVRLKCPPGSPACIDQPPPPNNDGCDASLAWWFTPEAYAPSKAPAKPKPKLPQQCLDVLQAP